MTHDGHEQLMASYHVLVRCHAQLPLPSTAPAEWQDLVQIISALYPRSLDAANAFCER